MLPYHGYLELLVVLPAPLSLLIWVYSLPNVEDGVEYLSPFFVGSK